MIEEKQAFMKAYTVKEVSKLLEIPPGTLRQWEKSLEDHLRIPRDERGERYYTDFEMNIIRNVKAMRDKGLTFEVIKQVLTSPEAAPTVPIAAAPLMSQSEAIQTIQNLQQALETLSSRMESIIEQHVRNQVSKLSESLDDQKKQMEQYLKNHDEHLMALLRELQEQRSAKKKRFLFF